MNWKEQLKEVYYADFDAHGYKAIDVVHDQIRDFIATEIIGQLIDDIPNEIDFAYPYGSSVFQELKQQLRDKWL